MVAVLYEGVPQVARIPRLTRAVEAVVSLFLARLLSTFSHYPAVFSFSRAHALPSGFSLFPLRALISLSSLNSLSSLLALFLRTQRVFYPHT